MYIALIEGLRQLPIGFERWCLEQYLDIDQIAKYFGFAQKATTNVFTRCFQYKILTNILPTQEYLFKYRAPGVENNHCKRCKIERDTIEHCLYECECIQDFLALLENWIKN